MAFDIDSPYGGYSMTIYALKSHNVDLNCGYNVPDTPAPTSYVGDSNIKYECPFITIYGQDITGILTINASTSGVYGSNIVCPFDSSDEQKCIYRSRNPINEWDQAWLDIYALEGFNDFRFECDGILYDNNETQLVYNSHYETYFDCFARSTMHCRIGYKEECEYSTDATGTEIYCPDEEAGGSSDSICLTYQLTPFPSAMPTEPTADPTNNPSSVPTSTPTNQPSVSPTRLPSGNPTDTPTPQPTQEPTGKCLLLLLLCCVMFGLFQVFFICFCLVFFFLRFSLLVENVV